MSECEIIKAQVRLNPNKELVLFYIDTSSTGLKYNICFSFEEGHSEWVHDYRLKDCKPVKAKTALEFAKRIETYYNSLPDSKVKIQVVTKLKL